MKPLELTQDDLLLLVCGLRSHKDKLYIYIDEYKENGGNPDAIKDMHKEISRCTKLQEKLQRVIDR